MGEVILDSNHLEETGRISNKVKDCFEATTKQETPCVVEHIDTTRARA